MLLNLCVFLVDFLISVLSMLFMVMMLSICCCVLIIGIVNRLWWWIRCVIFFWFISVFIVIGGLIWVMFRIDFLGRLVISWCMVIICCSCWLVGFSM